MIRATITVKDVQQVIGVYRILEGLERFTVVDIENRLKSAQQSVILKIDFDHCIIAEIKIRYGSVPINYYARSFIHELEYAENASRLN